MNDETTRLIDTLRTADEFAAYRDDLLVDVFRLWDCHRQTWVPDSPLLLRFESDDVVVRGTGAGPLGEGSPGASQSGADQPGADPLGEGPFKVTVGPVDTVAPADPEACLSWCRLC